MNEQEMPFSVTAHVRLGGPDGPPGTTPGRYYPHIFNPFAGGFASERAAKLGFGKWAQAHGMTVKWEKYKP